MNKDINILILSCGTRNKIVQYFKQELNGIGKVFSADSSEYAPALYEADQYFIVPRIDDPEYIATIFNICKENNISSVLSLIDPELILIAENKEKFLEKGIIPVISDLAVIELAFDKYKMNEFIKEQGFLSIPTYLDKNLFMEDLENGKIKYPVFVKPFNGSASNSINKVDSSEELNILLAKEDNLIIQKFMHGKEYGVDVYIDLVSGELVSLFIKEKIKMRAGETDKAISIKNEEIYDLVRDFIKKTEFRGVIDMDIFEVNNEYYISEVNPRFGGGYPHAYESGVNFPNMIINNLLEKENKCMTTYKEGIVMLKYNDLTILNLN